MGRNCGCLAIIFLHDAVCEKCLECWEGQCVSCEEHLTCKDLTHNITLGGERTEHSLMDIDLFCLTCSEKEAFDCLCDVFGRDVANIIRSL